jgi:hypothetical protein
MKRAGTARRALLFVIPLVVGAVAAVSLQQQNQPQKPTDIDAISTSYDSLASLITASDIVVVARAESVATGRVLTSPENPDAALKTEVVTLRVGDVLHGVADATVLLEQEATLADGTPITVNGVPPTQVGDEGVFFVDRSTSPDVPYVALVNDQSRYLVTGPARDVLQSSVNDAFSNELAALGPYQLRCEVLANGNTGRRC